MYYNKTYRSVAILTALIMMFSFAVAPSWHGSAATVYAIDCQPVNDNCVTGATKTSAMLVDHATVGGALDPSYKVEPDTGESWTITAYWQPAMMCMTPASEVATVDADWNGTTWVLSNFAGTANIVNVGICTTQSCYNRNLDETHSWEYKIIVDINDPGPNGWNLKEVKYVASNVDDGFTIANAQSTNQDCELDASVSPTSSTFTAWDDPNDKWFSSRCQFSCSVVGGSVTISYN